MIKNCVKDDITNNSKYSVIIDRDDLSRPLLPLPSLCSLSSQKPAGGCHITTNYFVKDDITDSSTDEDFIDEDNLEFLPLLPSPSLCFLQSLESAGESEYHLKSDYHLKSSIPSNIIFLVGSMLYMELCSMDWIDAKYYGNIHDD